MIPTACVLPALWGLAFAQDGTGPADATDHPTAPVRDREVEADGDETVYTFYGLLTLEADPAVSDEEKVQQWRAFVRRARQQLEYAEEAVDRWKNASRRRAIEAALATEADPETSASARQDAWLRAAEAQVDPTEKRKAKKRADFWRAERLRGLVDAAKRVEEERRSKVDRIAAWRAVVDCHRESAAGKAALSRIRALRDQLFVEARDVDAVPGVDVETKIEAWKDVLSGEPTPAQRKTAEARLRALSEGAASRGSGPRDEAIE